MDVDKVNGTLFKIVLVVSMAAMGLFGVFALKLLN